MFLKLKERCSTSANRNEHSKKADSHGNLPYPVLCKSRQHWNYGRRSYLDEPAAQETAFIGFAFPIVPIDLRF